MRKSGEVSPTLLVQGPEERGTLHPRSLSCEQDKDDFLKVGRLACLAHGAVASVLLTEAWMVQPKDGKRLDLSIPPSRSPDRQEIVSIMGETRQGHTQKVLPILRSETGEFLGFGEAQEIKADNVQGRFANFLPPAIPDQETRELAKEALMYAVAFRARREDEEKYQGWSRG